MGYTTEFDGYFRIDPPLSAEHDAYLRKFSETRRMKRDKKGTDARKDELRVAAGLEDSGPEGGYFVAETGHAGQCEKVPGLTYPQERLHYGIVDYNAPPGDQPGLWCQWTPTNGGSRLEWNGVEKFYDYVEWLQYLIDHFLGPWGYKLTGRVFFQGEYEEDRGNILCVENHIIPGDSSLHELALADVDIPSGDPSNLEEVF